MTPARLPVPPYLPALALPVVPWARHYVRTLAHKHQANLSDLWDEAVSALIRAALHYNPCNGARFSTYACNAVIRACWRYTMRGQLDNPTRFPNALPLAYFEEDALRHNSGQRGRSRPVPWTLEAPSTEELMLACETVASRLDPLPALGAQAAPSPGSTPSGAPAPPARVAARAATRAG